MRGSLVGGYDMEETTKGSWTPEGEAWDATAAPAGAPQAPPLTPPAACVGARAPPLPPTAAAAEDESLRRQVSKLGARNWSLIAKVIPGRSGKSCRLR
jgi:myb proto-oncogene protein